MKIKLLFLLFFVFLFSGQEIFAQQAAMGYAGGSVNVPKKRIKKARVVKKVRKPKKVKKPKQPKPNVATNHDATTGSQVSPMVCPDDSKPIGTNQCQCNYEINFGQGRVSFALPDSGHEEDIEVVCPTEAPPSLICPGDMRSVTETGDEEVIIGCQCNDEPVDAEGFYFDDEPSMTQAKANNFCTEMKAAYTENKCDESVSSPHSEFGVATCECKYPTTKGGNVDRYSFKDSVKCPRNPPEETQVSLDCLKDIEQKIKNCTAVAAESLNICNGDSDKNSELKNKLDLISGQAQSALQNANSVESCKTAGTLALASGYGYGNLSSSCETSIQDCQSQCASVAEYEEVQNIEKQCPQIPPSQREGFINQVRYLSGLVTSAYSSCASREKPTTAGKYLQKINSVVNTSVNANRSAVACEKSLSTSSEALPLTFDCATGRTTQGCPLNCLTSGSCKMQGGAGVAQIANLNKVLQSPSLGSAANNIKNSKGSLGNLDLGGDRGSGEGVGDGTLSQASDNSAGVFGVASAAPAGSTGSTGEGPNKDGKDKAGVENTEEKSFIGGTFSAMKNAASNFFGIGGSRNSFNKNSSGENNKNINNINSKKSMIRGLANTGTVTCYIDNAGARFCLGRKNSKSIFDMVSENYTKYQLKTLISN